MFARRNRQANFGSRYNRRTEKAQVRAQRSNRHWMALYRERKDRFERWNRCFNRFIPLTISRFRYFWAALTGLLSSLSQPIPTQRRAVTMARHGIIGRRTNRKRKKGKTARSSHKSDMSAKTYEAMEPKQMLAVDILSVAGDNIINSSEVSSFTVVGNGVAAGADVAISGPGITGTITVTADGTGAFTSPAIDATGTPDGIVSFTAAELDGSGLPTGAPDVQGAILDTTADVGADLALSVTDTTINAAESTAVSFSTSGIDTDVAVAAAIVSFEDSAGMIVTALASAGTVDLSTLADGPIATSLSVTDGAGNTADVAGPPLTLDTTADVGSDLSVTFDDVDGVINATEAVPGNFTVAGLDADASPATVTFSDGTNTITVSMVGNGAGSQNLSSLVDGPITATITATDGAGNTATATDTIIKETVAPTITSIDFSDTFIDESDIPGTVTLTIVFDESLDPSVIPAIALPQALAAATLTAPSAPVFSNTGGNANDTLSVTYTLVDNDIELADVLVNVSGAADLAGNAIAPVTNQSSGTSIDTRVETVTFNINDPDPQEDNLSDNDPTNDDSIVQAQVTFTIDQATTTPTRIDFRIEGVTATAGPGPNGDFVVLDPDGPGDGTSSLAGNAFVGTIVIGAGQTSAQLDIDIVPDFVLEGDETFTVEITNATIDGPSVAGQTPEQVNFTNPAADTVVIEDNETAAVVSLEAVDEHAAEGPLAFPAVDPSGASVLTDGGGTTRTTVQGVVDVFFIDVFDNEYDEVIITGTAGSSDAGDASVSVRFFYTDGSIVAAPSVVFPDGSANFEGTFEADPTLVLDRIEISVNTEDNADNGGNGGDFVFSGAQGVFKGGDTGLFRVTLDTELTSNLNVVIDTVDGEAVAGVDYSLQVESVPGSGVFDVPLTVAPNGRVTVTVPAGETSIDIQLTAIEDTIIEGGLTDSPGIEEAVLRIRSDSGAQANVVGISSDRTGTVKIEDNDFGSVSIETVDADANEGVQDSGGFVVELKTDRTADNPGAPTTSSQDVLVSVDITGDAVPGTDFRATINDNGSNTSLANAQRVDGFFSLQSDPNIQNSTTEAHNTINGSVTGGPAIHYFEVVLYEDGRITADIDGANFNSHLRILNTDSGQLADARFGNNNNAGDAGSSGVQDARIRTDVLDAGTYFIEVSRFRNNANGGSGFPTAQTRTLPLFNGSNYTLHVSISNMDEGVLIPAGQTSTSFNIDPIDDAILEGGTSQSFGSESVNFELTGFERRDPDIRIHEGGEIDEAVVITDNDSGFVNLVANDDQADEDPLFNSNPNDGQFTVSLQRSSTNAAPVTSSIDTVVQFTVSGAADLGDDYELVVSNNGSITSTSVPNVFLLTVPAGQSEVTITVDVNDDTIIEDQESVDLTLDGAIDDAPNSGDWDFTIDNVSSVVTIDDEDASSVTIDGTAFAQEGGQDGVFTVSLDSPHVSDTDTDVIFQLVFPAGVSPSTILADIDLSSILGGDVILFNASTDTTIANSDDLFGLQGVVRIPAFTPSAEINIAALDDLGIENTEFVRVSLEGIYRNQSDSNIEVTTDPELATDVIEVRDNDLAFAQIVAVQDAAEANTDGQFRVNLVDASGNLVTTDIDITVFYDVLNPSSAANPALTNDGVNADYRQLSGEVVILAGSSGADIDVEVFDDFNRPTNESDETVDLQLTSTDALTTQVQVDDSEADTEASITIFDDDEIEVVIEASDPYAREGNDNGQFEIRLTGFSDAPVEVDLGVLLGNGVFADATLGADYNLSGTVVTFAANQGTSEFVDLNVINDAVLEEFVEQAEVGVNSIISSNSGVSLHGDSAVVKIHPDPTVQVQALDPAGTEGGADASFIVHLPFVLDGDGPVFDPDSPLGAQIGTADGDLTVTYKIGGDATNGDDFTLLTGTVTIPAADGYAIINVDITDDNIIEDLERVSIQIESVTAANPNDGDVTVRRDLYSVSPDDEFLRVLNTDVSDNIDFNNDGSTDSSVAITIDGVAVNGGFGLALEPGTHDLYAVVETDDIFRALVIVDPATGIAELVGSLGDDDFRDIEFDGSGALRGVTFGGVLYTINQSTGAISGGIQLADSGQTDSLGFNPVDGVLFHGENETLRDVAGNVVAGTSGGFDFNALAHRENGNFAGNSFFAADNDDSDLDLHVFDDSTSALDAESFLFGDLDHNVESLEFVKTNAFVTISDNDTGFVEVKPSSDGADNLNDDVDAGFDITLRGPDGTTATTSDTDTIVAFEIDNTATPFLGAQTATGTAFQNIDGFPGSGFGGSLFFSPNGASTPHTIINGVDDATYTFTFTVLNDGDLVDIGFDSGSGTIQVFDGVSTSGANSLGIASSVFAAGLDAGTYTIRVVVDDANITTVDSFSLNVAIENHLIADYQLTTATGVDLTPTSTDGSQFQVTIPAGEESVRVVVDTFNDTQIEDLEVVSLWLDSVVDGDEDIHLGFAFFTDNVTGIGGSDGIGRVDIDGTGLEQILNTDALVLGDSDPFGISIDREEGFIYYSGNDPGVQGIFRAQLGFDGRVIAGTAERIVDTSFDPRGIVVAGDFVYWVDEDTSELHRARKDGSGVIEDLLDLPDSVSDLDDLAIDEVNNVIYWVDDGLDRISRANLDGSSIETIVQFSATNPGSPQSIALDVEGGKVYWTNAANDTIQRADLDGSNLQTIASSGTGFPSGIALDLKNDFVYWTDTSPGGAGVETIRRVFFGDLPATGFVALQPSEVVADVSALPGVQNLNHLEIDVRTHLHASVNIVDNDTAVVFVSTDNTLAEALDDTDSDPGQAREPGTSTADHKDIVVSLRDANGNPVTSQSGTTINYVFDSASTATNGEDILTLDGNVFIPAGTSSAALDSLGTNPSVFVIDDSVLEGDETVIVSLDQTSNSAITVVTSADPNYSTDEDTGFVVIVDDESAEVSIDAVDSIAKETNGVDEALNPGVFHIDLTQPSVSDTTVEFRVTTDAEAGDFTLSAPAANDLTLVSPGVYTVVIPGGNFNPGAVITVNVADDSIVEPNEFVRIEVLGTDNSVIGVGASASDTVTIFDNDVAKVIIENNGDATESTQPGASPGEDGQFVVSLVNPLTGQHIESETDTTVRVLLDAASTASFGADFVIPGFVDIVPGPGVLYAGEITFTGNGGIAGSAGSGAYQQFIDVELLAESPGSSTNPLDVGDEYVQLSLDPSFGVATDDRDFDGDMTDADDNDGVVGDLQIELDVAPSSSVSSFTTDGGGSGDDDGLIHFQFDEDNPWEDIYVEGMGMNVARVEINDETFSVSIAATDENAAEPGTGAGDSGQFTITIDNPFQFGDTIVNYVVTGTATTASLGDDISLNPNTTNPQDFADLDGFTGATTFNAGTSSEFTIDGQIVIPAGQSFVLLDVDVIDDLLNEQNIDPETVIVTLTGLDSELTSAVENSSSIVDSTAVFAASNRVLGTDLSATVNIFDNDGGTVTPSVSDGVAIEPDSPGNDGQFTLTLSNPSTTATTVRFTLGGDAVVAPFGTADTATDQGDYVIELAGASGIGGASLTNVGSSATVYDVTFAPGQTEVLIDLVTLDDFIIENDETATLTVNGVQTGSPGITAGGSSSIVIEDTDIGELQLDVLDGIALEDGFGDQNEARYVLRLVDQDDNTQRLASDTDVEVTFAVTGGTAALGADFDFGSIVDTVVIPAFNGIDPDFSLGEDAEATFIVFALDDEIVELTETVEVTTTAVDSGANNPAVVLHSDLAERTGVVSILDDDVATVSISSDAADGADPDAAETDPQGQNDGQFVVLLSEVSSTDTVVRFAVDVSNTEAFYGADFTLNGQAGPFIFGEVTIPAGDLSAPITLDVIDNLTQEDTENVTVELITVPGTNGVGGDQNITIDGAADSATIAIVDNDLPTFTVVNTQANEGDGQITFTIELSQPIDIDVDVFLNLSDGTATGAGSLDASVSNEDFINNDGGTVGNTGTVNFPANGGVSGTDLTRTITIDINDDVFVELDELFTAQLIIDGGSTPTTLSDGREVVILDNQSLGTNFGQALIVDNDTATFTITGIDGNDPTVDEGTNANPYVNNAALTTVSFEITSSNPIDVNVPLTVSFGGGTANGANFNVDGAPGSLQINQTSVPFGTDFDSGSQTVTFNAGQLSQTVHVGVVQDNIVEGGAATTLPSFGVETFVASLNASDSALGDRAHDDSDDSTATIHDRDAGDPTADDGGLTRGGDNDQAVITVVATDDEAAEPTDIPVFNNGVFTITQSNPSSTATVVRFQLSGDAQFAGPDADYSLTAFVSGTTTPVALVNLGGGAYTVEIPGSPGNVEITAVDVVVNVIDDDVTGDADDGDGVLEDDEQVTLTLVSVDSGDPEVSLGSANQSDTVQIDDDDEGQVSVVATDPDAAETDPAGQDDGRFVFFLRDNAGDLTLSDSDTVIEFQVALPTGSSPNTDPINGQANPFNDFTFDSNRGFTFDPTTGIGTITIPAGESDGYLDVNVVDDTLAESAEQVTVTIVDSISNPAGNADIDVDVANDEAVVTIAASDGLKVAITGTSNATEDDSNGTFVFSLLDATGAAVALEAGDTPGDAGIEIFFEIVLTDPITGEEITTADVGSDFQFNDSVIVGVGSSSEILTVDVNEDLLIEGDELISIRITGIQFVQGATPANELLDGEAICFDETIATTTIIDNDTSFAVTNVRVASTEFAPAFSNLIDPTGPVGFQGYSIPTGAGQDDTLPWVNLDTILVTFSEDVDVSTLNLSNFELQGLNDTPDITGLTYDAGSRTVRLELDSVIGSDRVRLEIVDGLASESGSRLNGEFTNGVSGFNTGDNVVGGDFNFDFNVLPGDSTRSADPNTARTTVGDASLVFGSLVGLPFGVNTSNLAFDIYSDVDGSGVVNVGDASAIFGLLVGQPFGFGLPSGGGSSSFSATGGPGNTPFFSSKLQADVDEGSFLTSTSQFDSGSNLGESSGELAGHIEAGDDGKFSQRDSFFEKSATDDGQTDFEFSNNTFKDSIETKLDVSFKK